MNHLYKVIYLRHAKTASSSLFCHFGGCRDEGAGDDASTAKLRFELLRVGQSAGRCWGRRPGMQANA